MGIGTSQPSNQVFYDAETGQYYTGTGRTMPNGFAQYGEDDRNYIGAAPASTNKNKISMVTSGMDRAQAAYDALMAGMGTNPAYNQYAMFPGMQMQSQPMTSLPMYGAGRFLSPAQAQDTGGVLGINSTQS
jgi:hypothetical protein